MPSRSFNQSVYYGLALAFVLALTWWAYAPGLRGDFLFDDFANLPALGATGPVHDWSVFWRYITSGTADPTGRPLTLLSFLLDARDWPADPFPFKRTSLILHLLNGVLLYALLAKLGELLNFNPVRRRGAALFGSAIWLVHPLMVSTTLYVVQREAMLPATCAATGLLLWLHGRAQMTQGRVRAGVALSVLGLGAFTVIGVLAKANGALLPVYALLMEWVVLAPRYPMPAGRPANLHQCILLVFCVIPTAAIVTYLAWLGLHDIAVGSAVSLRPWTIAQRLMTEPRILLDYLSLLWLPRPFSSGLFNDQYAASTSWLHPVTTLPAALAILALIAVAWRLRQRQPAIALAILFYFAGQLLESTSIPLELYFEHRNYLPAMLMFWPVGLWLTSPGGLRWFKLALITLLPLTLAGMTHASADVWGDSKTQAMIWARLNPESPRAQIYAADMDIRNGRPGDAERRLQPLLAARPNEVQLAFNLLGAHCMSGGLQPADVPAAQNAMRTSRNPGALTTHWFQRMLPVAQEGTCPGLDLKNLLELIDAGLQNPHLDSAGPKQDLAYLRGRIALVQRQPDAALAEFERALDLQVRPGMALEAAATLGASGFPDQGLAMLNYYEQLQDRAISPAFGMPMLHAWVLERQHYWPNEIRHLRKNLALDTQNKAHESSPHTSDSDSHR